MFDESSKERYWDKPWSLVSGCTRCSPGCDHCWALAMEKRFRSKILREPITGKFFAHTETSIVTHPERLNVPLKRKKPTVWSVWNDLFHEDVDISFQEKAFCVMGDVPHHTFLVLTKRPKQMAPFVDRFKMWFNDPRKNIWLGVTVCNRGELPKIDDLKAVPAAKLFVSIEPLLEDLPTLGEYLDGIDWLICGGETGPGARPMHPDWARSIRDQCHAASVPFFFKSWGEWKPMDEMDLRKDSLDHPGHVFRRTEEEIRRKLLPSQSIRVGKKSSGRLLDGRTWDQLPEAR